MDFLSHLTSLRRIDILDLKQLFLPVSSPRRRDLHERLLQNSFANHRHTIKQYAVYANEFNSLFHTVMFQQTTENCIKITTLHSSIVCNKSRQTKDDTFNGYSYLKAMHKGNALYLERNSKRNMQCYADSKEVRREWRRFHSHACFGISFDFCYTCWDDRVRT
jgi:hypothetical protein